MNMEAQKTTAIAGEYYLRGVMETASGFNLHEDNTFEFFFSYGAIDRSGEGTWEIKNDKLVLNSPKPKGQSFVLETNKVVNNDKITIRILAQNTFFLPYVYAIVRSGTQKLEAISDQNGLIIFEKQPVDSIVLLFEFAPEKTAVFAFSSKEDNYFEFRFDPSIMDVFFKNLALKPEDNGLSGQHPLLKPGTYHFEKH